VKSVLRRVQHILPVFGVALTFTGITYYIFNPSWPTPDKILILMVFVSLIFGRSIAVLKRFAPFVLLLLAYESLRGFVPELNTRVEYQWMIDVDKWFLGGRLPTEALQSVLWNGSLRWFDYALYATYMLHFVLPFSLALLVWRYRPNQYWKVVSSFIVISFAGFLTFLIMPAAPPWLASDQGYIEPIHRISSDVWSAFGLVDFPSVYNKISPNPVAAVPSLHAAYASLLCIVIWSLFGWKKGLIAMIYPASIYFGTVYMGEHYLIDELIGTLYAFAGYFLVTRWSRIVHWLRHLIPDRIVSR
jgi:membrane-associated phospholipid phosphatase